MKSLYLKLSIGLLMPLLFFLSFSARGQSCSDLQFTYVTEESRCMATGRITVSVTGGSGNYNFRVTGPVTTGFTSSNTITGLSAGNYTVTVRDITTGCVTDRADVIVAGSYADPRFALTKTDVTCMNGSDGTVSVTGLQYGRSPFTYTLVAPSASHLGESNSTGVFTNLSVGDYSVELMDSCGGRQTRLISVLNYAWWIDDVTVSRVGCDMARAIVRVRDSKGHLNTDPALFPGFQFGIARSAGDTVWSTANDFTFPLNFRRHISVVIKDPCGATQTAPWSDNTVPSLAANVTTSDLTCSGFTASINGQQNITSAQYELYNSSNALVTSNATGVFTNLAYGSYCMRVKDDCFDTTIVRCFELHQTKPSVDAAVSIWNRACADFTAAIWGAINLTNPVYRLYNSSNGLVATNSNGIFGGIPYGAYCIRITDACYDTTIERCFTELAPRPEIWGAIQTTNASCSTYSASIQGTSNLTNPTYCLYMGGTLVGCNSTGQFDNLTFDANYHIEMRNDACYDTVITRYFSTGRVQPSVGSPEAVNRTCSTFTAQLRDVLNWTDPEYCIFDSNNVRLACNTTGVFPNLPYGRYCIEVRNNSTCYDTVIRRCIGIANPVPSMNNININNRTCYTFTARTSGNNLTDPTYILYGSAGAAVDSNQTGIFNNIPYGYFCIGIRNNCYDTLIIKCSTEVAPKPEAGNVRITSKTCNTFQAIVENPRNLSDATYRLYDVNGNLVGTNTTGNNFRNVPYGAYTIRITTPCYDTTIVRNIDVAADPPDVSVAVQPSCTFGTTDLQVTFHSGSSPYTVQVRNPAGNLERTATSATSPAILTGLPALPSGQQYTVIGIDNCTGRDTSYITDNPSVVNKTNQVIPKCPSGIWANGSSDIRIVTSSNRGLVTPQIIRKNGATNTINFTNNTGTTYQFMDLEPATYIIAYSVAGCASMVYDTIAVAPYAFPGLHQSAAYQCDDNNFSVAAAVTGGCAPFTFEIIGSSPATPSIVTSAQNNPVFNIANGGQYTLVRLRAVDYCGNATLNDVNILPLGITTSNASSDCFYDNVTLSADNITNATYAWYKRQSNGDSVLIGTDRTYNIPNMLPADTGTYINSLTVHGGCISRKSYFHVTGACSGLLPTQVVLAAAARQEGVQLTWDVQQEADVLAYVVEHSAAANALYTAVGNVTANAGTGRNMYAFTHATPSGNMNYYRLRVITKSGKERYSNVVGIRTTAVSKVTLYPNPVSTQLDIKIVGRVKDSYKLTLMTATGQVVHEQLVQHVEQAVVQYNRGSHVHAGVYMLRVTALGSKDTFVYKVVFK